MNSRALFFVALATTLSLALAQCGKRCKFRFCKVNENEDLTPKGPRILLRDAGIAFPPFVCRRDITLDSISKTGEALVAPFRGGGRAVRISKYRPKGLNPRFAKNYFTLGSIQFPRLPGRVGMQRGRSKGNQDDFADQLCVILPITEWFSNGRKVVSRKKQRDCVSFVTVAPELLIELSWESGDDFDLVVEEPGGQVLSRRMTRSDNGRLVNDNNVGCGGFEVGKEQARYLKADGAPRGSYTVRIRHFENCNGGSTRYNLAVIFKGRLIKSKRGTSSEDGDVEVDSTSFRI